MMYINGNKVTEDKLCMASALVVETGIEANGITEEEKDVVVRCLARFIRIVLEHEGELTEDVYTTYAAKATLESCASYGTHYVLTFINTFAVLAHTLFEINIEGE